MSETEDMETLTDELVQPLCRSLKTKIFSSLYVFVFRSMFVHLMKLWGLVVGVVCLEEGVRVPSSCSLRVSMVE